jgi:3-isopropylmalate/(R)-2-methylmalate dehydratase small subunit
MEPFKHLDAVAAPMGTPNVDTDQIIPARFLWRKRNDGWGHLLFNDLRFNDDGSEKPQFVLNQSPYRDAKVLVADRNFGCGSSREHAPWALLDYGFRAVISEGVADIFRGNALKNGLLPVVVDAETSQWLLHHPGAELDIDLETLRLTLPTGAAIAFAVEPFARHCLLSGLDEFGYLRSKLPDIERFEAARG